MQPVGCAQTVQYVAPYGYSTSAVVRSVGTMIGPTTGALASVACIAATSSWWAVVRRTCVPSEHRGPNPDVRRSSTIDALSSFNAADPWLAPEYARGTDPLRN